MAIGGKWYNELGSDMEIAVDATGGVTGTYQTAVAEGPLPPRRPLLGASDANTNGEQGQSIGFVVYWGHAPGEVGSVSAWSGQYLKLKNGEELIITTWLLTHETEAGTTRQWTSTQVGQDVFTRTKPPQDQIDRALSLRKLSRLPTRGPSKK